MIRDLKSRLLAASAHQARESIVITDAAIDLPGPRIVFVNAAFTNMTGYTAEEVLGKTPRILQGPKTSRVLLKRLRARLEQGKVFNGEGINYRKDGSEFYIDWQIVPLRGADGAITHFLAFQRDITERRRGEQVLAESEARYRMLVESSPDAMLVQAEGKIVFANAATARLLGAERPEMIVGLDFAEMLSSDCRAEGQRRLLESAAKVTPLAQQTLVRPDGLLVKVESLGIPIIFAGKPAVQIILHDLTERLLLEEQFRQAQRLESLGMLAAGIAHDLNNVLAPILMGAPMLRETASTAMDRHFLTAMENSAIRGASLVRQILGFARGVGGEPQTIQMGYLLTEIGSILSRTFPKSIEIDLRVPKDLWTVEANSTQIHQVLLNLAVNARDAMPQGGELRLRAENCALDELAAGAFPGARAGRWVVLHVEDTGTGIPADVLERMWEPFFTTKPADKGTGLGLSTVRGIVETHGGFMIVQTAAGRGTTFRAYFPAGAGTLSVDLPVALAPLGQGELILVADDVAGLRSMVETVLTRYGYRVLLAVDGKDALAQFTRHPEIKLVITDLDMPTLTGSALAGNIRQLKPAMKILAMSGLKAASTDLLPPANFAEAFLLKPFTAQELLVLTHRQLHPARRDLMRS